MLVQEQGTSKNDSLIGSLTLNKNDRIWAIEMAELYPNTEVLKAITIMLHLRKARI